MLKSLMIILVNGKILTSMSSQLNIETVANNRLPRSNSNHNKFRIAPIASKQNYTQFSGIMASQKCKDIKAYSIKSIADRVEMLQIGNKPNENPLKDKMASTFQ